MQTFMTRETYGRTASDLDNARLGKQMLECMQIFDTLTGVTPNFYPHHPAMKMWEGYEFALGIYCMMLNLEWTFQRGFADHKALFWFYKNIKEMQKDDPGFIYECPPWVGDPAVLLSHRSNLKRKDASLYGKKWKNCPDNWPYLWPQIRFNHPEGYILQISQADKKRILTGERKCPDDETMTRVINWP